MTDDRFDELMKDAAATYRRPIEPPLEEMWKEIESRSFQGEGKGVRPAGRQGLLSITWVRVAATLVLGVAIGRASVLFNQKSSEPASSVAVETQETQPAPRVETASMPAPYQDATNKYLDQTTALLIALPSEVRAGRSTRFVERAGELLTTTRMLLDSPAAQDQSMRALLEDLELVLAQVVRLQNDRSRAGLDFINQALRQRDVIPRLRTAVADISAN
jgi:hypothetical protein